MAISLLVILFVSFVLKLEFLGESEWLPCTLQVKVHCLGTEVILKFSAEGRCFTKEKA